MTGQVLAVDGGANNTSACISGQIRLDPQIANTAFEGSRAAHQFA